MSINIERVLLVVSIITTITVGIVLGLQKVQSEPTTVYIQGCNHTIPLEELKIAPLEEIKGD